jgi:putative transposase
MEHQLRLPAGFQGFNPKAAMRSYERNLPHWRQPGATFFLTFRLNDSLPQEVLEELEQERAQWRERIAGEQERHQGSIPDDTMEEYQAFLIRLCRRVEKIMDGGHGSCVLRDPMVRQIVADALTFFEGKRCETHGYVVMPNHVHVAVKPLDGWQPEQLLHSWKSFTANEINKRTGGTGQLWQEDAWNRIVRNDEHWFRVMRYIMRNPDLAKRLPGESTVWVSPQVLDASRSVLREDAVEEPW